MQYDRQKMNDPFSELYMAGYSDAAIGREYGLTRQAVKYWRDANKLPSNVALFKWQENLSPEELAKIPVKYQKRR